MSEMSMNMVPQSSYLNIKNQPRLDREWFNPCQVASTIVRYHFKTRLGGTDIPMNELRGITPVFVHKFDEQN
jgi:hypothetical protein